MQNPNGQYCYSELTLAKAESYLDALRKEPTQAGVKLKAKVDNFHELNAQELIALLMNTRQPEIFAESATVLNGSDWNAEETSILGDISFVTFDTNAFNDGAHFGHQSHKAPLPVNLIYAAGCLLRNDHRSRTADMEEVLEDGKVNEENLYRLYERRLLPGLILQNQKAKEDEKRLFINIPGIGCGQFAGMYQNQVRQLLPKVLKKLFRKHHELLDMVDTVTYDPFSPNFIDEEDLVDQLALPGIANFIIRPLQTSGVQAASQLEFPKVDDINEQCRLVKIVAWDHFSYPGNDMWADSRATDDGVTFASTDTFLAMKNLGQFGPAVQSSDMKLSYNNLTGKVEVEDKTFSVHAQELESHVLPVHMLIVDIQGAQLHKALDVLKKELDELEPSSSEETKLHANTLYRSFEDIISKPVVRLEDFQQVLEENRSYLQNDLSVWDCFVNFLKRIANALLSVLPCTDSNRFFQPAKTPTLQSFENFVSKI
jgi:hypothetical protein